MASSTPSWMVVVPPPVWGAIFLVIAWLIGLALPPAPAVLTQLPLGIVLVVVGLAIGAPAALAFRRAGTEIQPTSPSNRVLVVTGPFRFTRNPMYLGMLVMMIGIAFLIGSWPMLLAPLAFFILMNAVSMPFEEDKMARQFGDAYAAYKSRVRRWL